MTLPPLPRPAHEQVEEYSGIAMNKVVVTPLFTADQMRAYGAACAAAERERCAKLVESHPTNGDAVQGWFDLLAAAIRALTDEQLKQAMSDAGVRVFQPGLWDVLLDAGRAIERAHGITGEPT